MERECRQAPLASPGHPFTMRLSHYLDLDSADLHALEAAMVRIRMVRKNRHIISEGYYCNELSFMESGIAVRYKLLSSGRRQLLDVAVPGDVIGIPSAFFKSCPLSAMSISDVTLRPLPLAAFVKLCRERPAFAIAMLAFCMEELAAFADRIASVGRRTPLERMANFLLQTHARLKLVGYADEHTFQIPLSQELLGDLLALSAPHVNRVLQRLRAEHLIKVHGRVCTLVDISALQMLGHHQHLESQLRDYLAG